MQERRGDIGGLHGEAHPLGRGRPREDQALLVGATRPAAPRGHHHLGRAVVDLGGRQVRRDQSAHVDRRQRTEFDHLRARGRGGLVAQEERQATGVGAQDEAVAVALQPRRARGCLGGQLGGEPGPSRPPRAAEHHGERLSRAGPVPGVPEPGELDLPPEQRRTDVEPSGQRRAGRRVERRVLRQHTALELAQLGPGVDPQLVRQHVASSAPRLEGRTLAALAVERQHQQRPPPLAQGVLGDQPFQLRDGVRRAGREVPRPQVLGRRQAQLLQPATLGPAERGLLEARVGRPAPQHERLLERRDGRLRPLTGKRLAAHGHEAGEALGVELDRVDGESVTTPVGHQQPWAVDPVRLEDVAQPQHVVLQCLGG